MGRGSGRLDERVGRGRSLEAERAPPHVDRISGRQQDRSRDALAVDEGPVRRSEIDQDEEPVHPPLDAGVIPGQPWVVTEPALGVAGTADLEVVRQ